MIHFTRPTAWKLALLAGFIIQLLLIVFVTAIGLQQLRVATNNLNQVIDVHMHKQSLTKAMVIAARERSMYMLMLIYTTDPFERDDLLMEFYTFGTDFILARQALLALPLNERELELLQQQERLTGVSTSIQDQVVDLISTDKLVEARQLTITQAIPRQDDVLIALSQLDTEGQHVAEAAAGRAYQDHIVARFWLYVLSIAALLVGVIVAVIVFYFVNRISRESEKLATQDVLTGLPNRLLFMDRLEQSLLRAKRNSTLVGVMFIDLDQFKRVNDTLGHASGDQLICGVAKRLRAVARAQDIVARLGGDEFVIVIGDAVEIHHILKVAEKNTRGDD